MTNRFEQLDKKYGFPDGTLASLYQQETSSGRNVRTSSAGARGHFQFMPAARADSLRKHGIDPWSNDVDTAAQAAALLLKEHLDRYDGDLLKALSAYNAGPGNVNKAVKKYGDNWLSHMRPETQNYGPKILKRIGIESEDAVDTHTADRNTQKTSQPEIQLDGILKEIVDALGTLLTGLAKAFDGIDVNQNDVNAQAIASHKKSSSDKSVGAS